MTNLQLDASAMLEYEIWIYNASGTRITIGKSGENNKYYVFEPTVSRKLDGISTFTFSLYTAYQETGGWKENELSKLLKPETKVNVSLTTAQKTKEYAFIIKKITQDCTNYKNSYTCEDYYVNELSKSGYSISFSEKERNNINTLEGFAEQTINGLDSYVIEIQSNQSEGEVKNLITFDPTLDRYVDVCKSTSNEQYYHYSETKYEVDAIPVNMISNGYSIKSANGWTKTNAKAETGMLPKAIDGKEYLAYLTTVEKVWGLKLKSSETLVNLGLSGQAEAIGDLFTGDQLVFNYKIYEASQNGYVESTATLNCRICEYKVDNGIIIPIIDYLSGTVITQDLTKQILTNSEKKFGIFISTNNASTELYISEIELYKKIGDGSLTPASTLTGETIIEHYYYSYGVNDTTKSTPIYRSGSLDDIQTTDKKYRTVNARESNRFNILQSIAEAFQVWCIVDGYRIVFSDSPFLSDSETYEINYGQNLSSIKRNYDSGEFATKLIVKDNNNKYAPNGFCSISRASKNTSKENVIYDFEYYGDEKLLSAQTALIANLGNINKDKEQLTDKLTSLASSLVKSEGNKTLLLEEKNATENEIKELKDNLLYKTKYAYEDILDNSKYPEGKDTNLDAWRKEPKIIASLADISIQSDKLTKLETDYTKVCTEYDELKKSYDEISKELQTIASTTENLISEFERTYRHLIREASWTSNDYIDNDKYYEDAIAALHKNSKPKVSYDVSAIYFGHINKKYDYDLGCKVLIDLDNKSFTQTEGTEIVERKNNSHYEEDLLNSESNQIDQFFITEFTLPFDNPEKGSIKIKNYRSPFKDLFQKIQLNSQQLQFHSGEWDNASAAFTVDGNVRVDALADAFANNSNALKNASNQTVIWDDKGITTTSKSTPAEITRITSGGIFLTTDGGTNWTTGITAKGINARTITSGEINTGLVNIYSGADIAFRWDADGITAYKDDGTRFSNNNFVRYNQFGIFGINDGADCSTEADIKKNAKFYLGWDGLFLNEGVINMVSDTSSVKIDPYGLGATNNVFEIISKDKQIFAVDTSGNAFFAGDITGASGTFGGQLQIGGTADTPNFIVDINGNVTLNGNITWGAGASPTLVLYTQNSNDTKPINSYDSYNNTSNETWHKILGTNDKYCSYTYDGGHTWTEPVQVVGADGTSVTIVSIKYARSTSNTDAPSEDSSWEDTMQTATGTYPYLWSRVTYSDGQKLYTCLKGSVTRDELWGFIKDNDGIYEDNDGNIAIRASAIISGALQVGGTAGYPDSDDVKFYVGMDDSKIRIGGFTVDNTSISINNLGSKSVVYLGSKSLSFSQNVAGCSSEDWRLVIGQNFGVTSGGMYSTSGKIGGFSIDGNSISIGTWGTGDSIFLTNNDNSSSLYIADYSTDTWRLGIGSKFGVTKTGDLYCSSARFGNWSFSSEAFKGYKIQPNELAEIITITPVEVSHRGSIAMEQTITASWRTICTNNQTGSDKKIKRNIELIQDYYENFFEELKPSTFQYIDDTLNSLHFGFIAQDIEQACENNNISNFAGIWKEQHLHLNKQEFIALNTWQIQKLKSRVAELEEKIKQLQA